MTFEEFQSLYPNELDGELCKDVMAAVSSTSRRIKWKHVVLKELEEAGCLVKDWPKFVAGTGWMRDGRGDLKLFTIVHYWLYLRKDHSDPQYAKAFDEACNAVWDCTFEERCARLVVDDKSLELDTAASPETEFGEPAGRPGIIGFNVDPISDSETPPPFLRSSSYFVQGDPGQEFHYANTASEVRLDVLGRDAEMATLKRFLDDEARYSWLQIAGEGGQGKSRLAFELINWAQAGESWENQDAELWHAGFYDDAEWRAPEGFWEHWQPKCPTLIVFDYAIGAHKAIAPMMESLYQRRSDLNHNVRVILIERQRWDRARLEADANGPGLGDRRLTLSPNAGRAEWFLQLINVLEPEGPYRSDRRAYGDPLFRDPSIENGVVELLALNADDLCRIIEGVAGRRKHGIGLSRDEILERLAQIDVEGRPLFAYFFADSVISGEARRDWTRDDLLRHTLRRLLEKRWRRVFPRNAIPRWGEAGVAMQIAVLATMAGGLEFAAPEVSAVLPLTAETDRRAAVLINDGPLGEDDGGLTKIIPPLLPDVLGEFSVLQAFEGGLLSDRLIGVAWTNAPTAMAGFLVRLARDFPGHPQTRRLLSLDPPCVASQAAYAEVASLVAGNLWQDGQFSKPRETLFPAAVIAALERAVEADNTDAITAYGFFTSVGVWRPPDPIAALSLWKQAADNGDAGAMCNLGVCYLNGIGLDEPVHEVALEWFSQAADKGHARAMFCLGVCLHDGIGLDNPNPKRALEWYHKAADLGISDAMVAIGICHKDGDGLDEPDPKNALEWYHKAAEQGQVEAMLQLGVFHQFGTGLDAPNLASALEWYSKAAEQGQVEAMFRLGVLHQLGTELNAPNLASALEWYNKAANSAHCGAMYNLGVCHEKGYGLESEDPTGALAWYRKAATNGHVDAMVRLADFYYRGTGIDKPDLKIALEWYCNAADKGHAEAMYKAGVFFEHGGGLKWRDLKGALEWYRKAANTGHADAMHRLGVFLQYGAGLESPDPNQALEWFREAADAGNANAMLSLGFCHQEGIGLEEPDPKGALEWYRKAADMGDATAMASLGHCHRDGTGLDAPDPNGALRWYRRAADSGDVSAKSLLGCFPDHKSDGIDESTVGSAMALDPTIPWPLDPLVAGDWRLETGSKARILIQEFLRFPALREVTSLRFLALRTAPLTCYPDHILVEALIGGLETPRIVCAVLGKARSILLNGDKGALLLFNTLVPWRVSNIEIAQSYLRFLNVASCGEYGTFRVLDKLSHDLFAYPLDAQLYRKLALKVSPPTLVKETAQAFEIESCIVNGSFLSKISFEVGRDGKTKIIGETIIGGNLSLYKDGFDGPLRYRR